MKLRTYLLLVAVIWGALAGTLLLVTDIAPPVVVATTGVGTAGILYEFFVRRGDKK